MGKWISHSKLQGEQWPLWQDDQGKYSNDQVQHALLMDIRAELKRLNAVMQCPNVMRGFLAFIEMNQRDEKKFRRRVAAAVRRKLKEKQR